MEYINDILTAMEGKSLWIAGPIFVFFLYSIFAKIVGEEEARGLLKGVVNRVANSRRRMIALDRRDELEDEITRLGDTLKKAKALNDEYEATITQQHRYILYINSEIRRIELWASENQITLPPPPLQTYTVWSKIEDSD